MMNRHQAVPVAINPAVKITPQTTATNRPSPATTSWGEGTHETKVRADLSAANKSLIHIGVWITGYQLSFFDSFCFFLAILTDDI
jgi:hypothetical protein